MAEHSIQLVFILVFLPSWRIWNSMREFLNNYYMDDMVQQTFKLWILVLSVFYGNQLAYLAEDIDQVKTWVISTYLIILGSFLLIELVYSIFIKWLRRLTFIQSVLRLPGIGLWITAIYLHDVYAVGPVVAAVAWEYVCAMISSSRLVDKFTPSEYKKALDVDHFQSRMANFFIITLGEGVLQLIKDGPLGRGLNGTTGFMVWILLVYYELSLLYFNRDGSKRFVPAIKQEGKKTLIWVSFHIPLFASILTFASGVMFIVRHGIKEQLDVLEEQQIPDSEIPHYMYNAVWTSAVSLAIIIFSMTGLALLDKSLDEPGSLRINNRYIRLGGRLVYIIVILSVPATTNIDARLFLGIAALMLVVVTSWEWVVCMDRGSAFIEPEGLSLLINKELKGKK
jgi:low temperature requirement protein LtrA